MTTTEAGHGYAMTTKPAAGDCGCTGDCGGGTDPCGTEGAIGLERTRWFGRMLVGPDDLTQDQRWLRAAQRRHNRLLHGWGVVCGLRVAVGSDPCGLVVESGYSLGPWGHEIVVPEQVELDACAEDMEGNARGPCGDVDPWCSPVRVARDPDRPLYLAIRHAECETRPVRVYGAGCGCDEFECEYSRTRDSFVLKLLEELPMSHRDMQPPSLASLMRGPEGCPPGCPPCPADPWVVLATVMVQGEKIADVDCDSHRRHVLAFGRHFYLCAQRRPVLDPHIRKEVPVMVESRPPSEEEAQRIEPVLITARRADRSWILIPLGLPVGPDDLLEDLVRKYPREFTDPETGETVSLQEIVGTAGLDPKSKPGSLEGLAGQLELIDLGRTRDRRVVGAGLHRLLDASGRKGLQDRGDAPERVRELPATSLRGIGTESEAGKRLAKLAVGELAQMDDAELEETVTKGLAAAKREGALAAAREARLAAQRVTRLADAWEGRR